MYKYLLVFFLIVNTDYSINFNETKNVCDWAEYNISYDEGIKPARSGKFADFQPYKNIRPADYSGSGYDRGHLIGWAMINGDLNNNGEFEDNEVARYKEINSMKNMAPQKHALNGPGGSWFECEEFIRDKVVNKTRSARVIVGTIFGPAVFDKFKNIEVPPLFYQIIITENESMAFLLPHQRFGRHTNLREYLVSIDLIEALSGHDFDLDDYDEASENLKLFERISEP